MTTHHAAGRRPRRRLRALLVGLAPEAREAPRRILRGPHGLVAGGPEHFQDDWLETLLRLETELERRGRELGDVPPAELAEIAWTIDSPELHQLALRLHRGLRARGLSFHESTPEQLTAICLDEAASEPAPEAEPDPVAGEPG